jgi:hypothetical protein
MNKFCESCGAPLSESSAFCGACGARRMQAANTTVPTPVEPVSEPVPQPAAPPAYQRVEPVPVTGAATMASKSSSPLLKIIVIILVILFVCGALAVGGVIYVAHKVTQKAHEVSQKIMAEADSMPSPTASTEAHAAGAVTAAPSDESKPEGSSEAFAGDACKLLSSDDVGNAIGIAIVDTHSEDGGCTYFAKGTGADMAAKHAAAMVGSKGADKKTQGMIEQFAGGMLSQMPKDTSKSETTDGKVVVFNFSIINNGKEQMSANKSVMGILGSQQALDGIGDEAYVEADSMIMVRKGDKLIHIMYMSCPCGTDAVKPLAKKLASAI